MLTVKSTSIYIIFFVFFISPIFAFDIEHLTVDDSRDSWFLPYKVELMYQYGNPGNESIIHPIGLIRESSGKDSVAIFYLTSNREPNVDLPSHLAIYPFPQGYMLTETPIPFTIKDAGVFKKPKSDDYYIWLTGFRHDSAFISRFNPANKDQKTLCLNTGKDETGNGKWECFTSLVLAADYDFDGSVEQFFYLNSQRDENKRTLYCIDMESFQIEWQLPVSSTIDMRNVYDCHDSSQPSILVVSYAPAQGKEDSIFSDQFGYFTRIGLGGKIINNFVINRYAEGCPFAGLDNDTLLYVGHTLPFVDPHSNIETSKTNYFITIVNRKGSVEKSINVPEMVHHMTFADFNDDGSNDLYTVSAQGRVRIYTRDLEPLAETNPISLGFEEKIKEWGNESDVICFGDNAITIVYSKKFKKLSSFAKRCAYYQILQRDNQGRMKSFIGGNDYESLIFELKEQGVGDFIGILYHENEQYVIGVLLSILTGLVIVNYFRRRVSRQKSTIEEAHKNLEILHKELAETHEALKAAQQTIIAQEKYVQAKNIAGGFAHEIRNALFPADASFTRLRSLGDLSKADPKKVESLHTTINDAVSRAIDITMQISYYTRLISESHLEMTNVSRVVDKVLVANRIRIEDKKVTVRKQGDEDIKVVGNENPFYSVINNLVLNSLDALSDQPHPEIIIEWKADNEYVQISVSDNGSGISDENMKRIFDEFFSTKPNTGTGLGLSIVKRVVELFGGTITVSSKLDEGTTFNIRLKRG